MQTNNLRLHKISQLIISYLEKIFFKKEIHKKPIASKNTQGIFSQMEQSIDLPFSNLPWDKIQSLEKALDKFEQQVNRLQKII